MKYKARNYEHLFGMEGFSNRLLENHFTLYQGYVDQTNQLLESFKNTKADGKSPEFAELRRRFGWEFNGMRLHEFYFDNLGGKNPLKQSAFKSDLEKSFGSFANWQKDFEAVGAMRGIGWAILYFDAQGEKLINTWIDEHDEGHLAGATPLLIMDVFEHAFFLDYGLARAKYIDAFVKNIRWEIADERYEFAKESHSVAAR